MKQNEYIEKYIFHLQKYLHTGVVLTYVQWRQTGLRITSANGAGQRILGNKINQHKVLYTIFSGRGKKTTSAMALMDWSVWRH